MLPEGEVPYVGFEDQASHSGTLTTKIDESVQNARNWIIFFRC